MGLNINFCSKNFINYNNYSKIDLNNLKNIHFFD